MKYLAPLSSLSLSGKEILPKDGSPRAGLVRFCFRRENLENKTGRGNFFALYLTFNFQIQKCQIQFESEKPLDRFFSP